MSNIEEELFIRPYLPSDQEPVIDLWLKTGLVVAHNDPVKDIELKLQVDADLFLVGVSHERVIASVMGGFEGHRGWVNYLAVHPEKQGRGIGRKLMNAVEQLLAKRGCPKINMQIRRSNKDVIEFYTALGYLEDDVISLGKRVDKP